MCTELRLKTFFLCPCELISHALLSPHCFLGLLDVGEGEGAQIVTSPGPDEPNGLCGNPI